LPPRRGAGPGAAPAIAAANPAAERRRPLLGDAAPAEQRAPERHGRLHGEGVALPRPRLAGFVLGTGAAACWGLGTVSTKAALAGYSPEVVGVVRLGAAALSFRGLARPGPR